MRPSARGGKLRRTRRRRQRPRRRRRRRPRPRSEHGLSAWHLQPRRKPQRSARVPLPSHRPMGRPRSSPPRRRCCPRLVGGCCLKRAHSHPRRMAQGEGRRHRVRPRRRQRTRRRRRRRPLDRSGGRPRSQARARPPPRRRWRRWRGRLPDSPRCPASHWSNWCRFRSRCAHSRRSCTRA